MGRRMRGVGREGTWGVGRIAPLDYQSSRETTILARDALVADGDRSPQGTEDTVSKPHEIYSPSAFRDAQ